MSGVWYTDDTGGGFVKKKALFAAVLVLLVVFAAVRIFDRGGDICDVERIVGQSTIYTEAEI